MNKFIVSVLFLSFAFSYAQNTKIKWGEFDKFKGMPMSDILAISEDEFFDLNFKPQGFALTYSTLKFFPIIRYFKNNTMVKELNFEGNAPGKNESYEYFKLIDGKAIMFTTTREKDETGFYAYEIDKSLNVGKAKKLMNRIKEPKESFYFTLRVSDNGEYFAILLGLEDKKNDLEKFEYEIFTKDFNSVGKGKYDLPYSRKECDIDQHHISNTGEYFVSYKVYETDKSGKVRDLTKLKKYVIRQLTGDAAEDYEIAPNKGSVRSVNFNSNDQGSITLTGLWGSVKNAIQGVFNMVVDFKKKEITFEHFHDFDKSFILEAYPVKVKEKYEKKENEGKLDENASPALFSYVLRDLIPLKDGGSVVLMEQSYIRERTTRDSQGNYSTVYVYNENGVIAYKIEANGTIGWTTYIHKEQSTTNDGGYAISFGHIWNDEHLVLYFHDNIKNYTASGKYNKERHRASFMKKNYCFAQATLDIKTGEVKRSMVHDLKTGIGFVLPQQIGRTKSNSTGILVMVKQFNKAQKRYGSVKL